MIKNNDAINGFSKLFRDFNQGCNGMIVESEK